MKKNLTLLLLIICLFVYQVAAAAQRVIVFATTQSYKPYAFIDAAGYVHGFDISFAQLVCAQMKVTCRFKPMFFAYIFNTVKANKVDAAIGAIAITPDREKEFNFTIPYLPSISSFITVIHPGVTRIARVSPQVLQGKIVGVQTRSLYPRYLLNKYPHIILREYLNPVDLVAALSNKQVDFIVMDTPAAQYWVNQAPNNLYVVGQPINLGMNIGIMLNKQNTQLLMQLNRAIYAVTRSPQYTQLVETFFQNLNPADRDLM